VTIPTTVNNLTELLPLKLYAEMTEYTGGKDEDRRSVSP
jgi:hypothetical protein